jgi:hypothetical protein
MDDRDYSPATLANPASPVLGALRPNERRAANEPQHLLPIQCEAITKEGGLQSDSVSNNLGVGTSRQHLLRAGTGVLFVAD